MFAVQWPSLAGLGCPAIDLATSNKGGHDDGIGLYRSIAGEQWRTLTVKDVKRMVQGGRTFRNVAAIRWACESLHLNHAELAWENLSRYLARLRNVASQLD